jgi:hypothetical protein
MTEEEWLESTNCQELLAYLKGKASPRKLRLFACACARRYWDELPDKRSRRAVEISERYADRIASKNNLDTARANAKAAYLAALRTNHVWAALAVTESDPWIAAATLAGTWANSERHGLAVLLRDIFGNPFRPVVPEPSWLTPGLTVMARGIYEDRAFVHLPVLADALEEAGCTDPDLLGHLRGPGPHLLGCWAIDLILRKS